MYSGLNKILWGYILLTFKINIGTIPIFHPLVGFFVIFLGLKELLLNRPNEKWKFANILVKIAIILNFIFFFLTLNSDRRFIYLALFQLILNFVIDYSVIEGVNLDLRLEEVENIEINLDRVIRNIITWEVIIVLLMIISFFFIQKELFGFLSLPLVILKIYVIYWIKKCRDLYREDSSKLIKSIWIIMEFDYKFSQTLNLFIKYLYNIMGSFLNNFSRIVSQNYSRD